MKKIVLAAAAVADREASADALSDAHLSHAQMQQLYHSFGSALVNQDASAMSQVVTSNFYWYIPGSSAISGATVGIPSALKRGYALINTYQDHVQFLGYSYSGSTMDVTLRDTGTHNGKTLDVTNVDRVHFANGKIDSIIIEASNANIAQINAYFS